MDSIFSDKNTIMFSEPFTLLFVDKNRKGKRELYNVQINNFQDLDNLVKYYASMDERKKYRQLSNRDKKRINEQLYMYTQPARIFEEQVYNDAIEQYRNNFNNLDFNKNSIQKYDFISDKIYDAAYKQIEEEFKPFLEDENFKRDLETQIEALLENNYETIDNSGRTIKYLDMELYPAEIQKRYILNSLLSKINADDENKGNFYIKLADGSALKLNFQDEENRRKINDLLEGKLNYNDCDYDNHSDDNSGKTYGINDIVQISKTRPNNLFIKGKDYKYKALRTNKNGGFLPYKLKSIDEIYNFLLSECDITENLNEDEIKKYILTELIRCQISYDLSDKIFKNNCLSYAVLIASGNQKLYKTIKINSINKRIISSDFLIELGTAFNIKFIVYDVEQEKSFQYPKIFKNVNPIEISICLYKKHFFINEELKLFRHKLSHKYISSHYLVKNCHTNISYTYSELLKMPFCDENAMNISLCSETDFYKNDFREYQMKEEYKNYIINYKENKDLTDEEIDKVLEDKILVFADCEASVGPDYEYFELVNELNQFENELIENFNINFDKLIDFEEKHKIEEIENYTTIQNYNKLKKIKESVYYHEAYCISYTVNNEYTNIKSFYGKNCLYKFMDEMAKLTEKGRLIVYFHNAGYDLNLFGRFNFKSKIQKGNKILSATILYNNRLIEFHDSLALLTMSIKACAGTFCTKENIKKEMFPYKFYNNDIMGDFLDENKMVDIESINEEIEGPKFNIKDLIENCIHLDLLNIKLKDYNEYINYISEEHYPVLFDTKKYCLFYCEQDVRILAMSFNKLRRMFAEQFKLDITNYISLPAIASALMKANVLTLTNGNEKNYEVSGEIQEFIRGAIYGGRCMTSQNKSWITNQKVISLDYVSLYSSAMILLPTIFGTCEIMTEEEIRNNNYLNLICDFDKQPNSKKYISGYVVEIVITKINSFKHFPTATFKTDLGSQYIDKDVKLPQRLTLVDIMLEDILESHDIEFYTIQGVKYTGHKDFKALPNFIQFLYDKRAALKTVGNPAQLIYKLILNSSYGKLIQKLIECEIKFVRDRKIKNSKQINKELKPIIKNLGFNTIEEYLNANPEDKLLFDEETMLLDCTLEEKKQFCQKIGIDFDEELIERYKEANAYKILKEYKISEHLYELEERKNKLTQFSDPYLGARILAMSKRIMNKTFKCVEGVENLMKSLIYKKNTINKYQDWLIRNNKPEYLLNNPIFQDIKIEYEEELKEMGYSKEQNPDLFDGDLINIVFYQDTDSIYMKEKYLPQLKAIYKNLYNKDLYGENQLGRMHIDFEESEINTKFTAKINGKTKPIYDKIEESELKDYEKYQMNYKIIQFHDYGELKTKYDNKYFVVPYELKEVKNCNVINKKYFETYDEALNYKRRIEETHIETDKETGISYAVYNINKDTIRANKSIFITKKLYYCQLFDYTSKLRGDHVRSKGIPIDAFEYYVNEHYTEDEESKFYKLYKDLLINKAEIKIDLLKTGANIKTEKNIRVSSLKKFERTVKVNKIDYSKLRYKNDSKTKIDEYKLKDIPFRFDEIKGPYFIKSEDKKNEYELGISSMVQIENDYKKPGYSQEKHEIVNKSNFEILSYSEFYEKCYKINSNSFDTDVLFYIPKGTSTYQQEQIKNQYKIIKEKYNIKYFYEALRNDEMFKLIVDNGIMRCIKSYEINEDKKELIERIGIKEWKQYFKNQYNISVKNNEKDIFKFMINSIIEINNEYHKIINKFGITDKEFDLLGSYYEILKNPDTNTLKSIGEENLKIYYSALSKISNVEEIINYYKRYLDFKIFTQNVIKVKTSKLRITGRAYNLKYCNSKVLIDVDYHSEKGNVLSEEEKINFMNKFINFGVGEITLTPNGGLHILLDLNNEELKLMNSKNEYIYRFIDCFNNNNEGWNIDVMFSSDKTSFVHDYESIGLCKTTNTEIKYKLLANYQNKSFNSFLIKFYEAFNCYLIDWNKYKFDKTEILNKKRKIIKKYDNLYCIGIPENIIKMLTYNGKHEINNFEMFKYCNYEIHRNQKTDLIRKKLNILSLIKNIKDYTIECKKYILNQYLTNGKSKAGPHAKELIKTIISNFN